MGLALSDTKPVRFAFERLAAYGAALARGLRAHALLYVLAFLTYAIAVAEGLWLGVPLNLGLVGLVTGTTLAFLFLMIFLWLAGDLAWLWYAGYKGSPFLALKSRLLGDILAPERVSNTVHAFLVNGIFFVGFLGIKKSIPAALPFSWDGTFMELDRALHFGFLPHEILAPLIDSPLMIFLVNVNYNLWFVVLLACFFWQGFAARDNPLRQKFLLAYLLSWFIGTCVLGTIFSSAGPCFYAFVETGISPYAGLMAKLASANEIYPVWAVPTQAALWQSHLAGHGEIEGVSAMPSMHVATTILFVLLGFASGKRWLGWFFVAFAASIFLGSIVLGWHYAVDGYAGAAIALACWKLAGWIVERRMPA